MSRKIVKHTCQICGEEVVKLQHHLKSVHNVSSDEYYLKYINSNKGECKYCKSPTKFQSIIKGYNNYCSSSCRAKHNSSHLNSESAKVSREKTMIEKYGSIHPLQSKEIMNKFKSTCQDRYGTDHHWSNSDVVNKRKETFMHNYGVDHPLKSEEVQSKVSQTCQDRYGVDNVFKSDVVKDKIKSHYLDNYEVSHHSQVHFDSNTYKILSDKDRLDELLKSKTRSEICQELKVSFRTLTDYMIKHDLFDQYVEVSKSETLTSGSA